MEHILHDDPQTRFENVMRIDHYVECGVCNGKSNSNISSSRHSMTTSDHLLPGNNFSRGGSFRERNEGKGRALPLRSGSFREPAELKREKNGNRRTTRTRSALRRDTPDRDINPLFSRHDHKGSLPLPSSTPNLHKFSQEDNIEIRERDPSVRRVRSFKTTTKGIVNRGDSVRKRGSRVASTEQIRYTYSPSPRPSPCPSRRVPLEVQVEKVKDNVADLSYFKVIILGANGTGKSTITQQFLTSEYVAFDNSLDNNEDNVITVQLNGEESTLEFIDREDIENNLENIKADAYVVVFSIAHRDTFHIASDLLSELRMDLGTDRTVILVGNKLDLVRKRTVKTEEALETAGMYDARYLEVSAGLNHRIDELLVGMLALIRYKLDPSLPAPVIRVEAKKSHVAGFSFKTPFSFFSRLFQLARNKFKSDRKH